MTDARRCIFYRTLAIDPGSRIGSGLRPAKLLAAFQGRGYEVDVVAGNARQRIAAIDAVKRKMAAGTEYDFFYAEPPTTPVALNESHHLPTHPLMDYRFMAYCHSRGIPVILFYSDVQWRLRDYPRQVGWPKYLAALPFFHLDLFVYRKVVDAWLVPHRGMLAQIASWAPSVRSWESIPGFDPLETPPPRAAAAPGAPLRLFYVGGVEPPVYDLTPLLRGSAWAAGHGLRHELTICCRQPEWLRRPASYEPYLGAHVKVVHNANRQELLELYTAQDIAVMPYGTTNSDWAMPIKFPEAIGMGLPILAGRATAVGRVVEEQGIGWTLRDSENDLHDALGAVDRAELERVRSNVIRVRPSYEWAERAREIVAIAQDLNAARRDRVPGVA